MTDEVPALIVSPGRWKCTHKDDGHVYPTSFRPLALETPIKTVKSIGHPVLYDLCAAGVLMQHLAPDPQVNFQHLLSVIVFYVVHKPPQA